MWLVLRHLTNRQHYRNSKIETRSVIIIISIDLNNITMMYSLLHFYNGNGNIHNKIEVLNCNLSYSFSCLLIKCFHTLLQLWPKVSDQALHWPGRAVTQCANRMALNLLAQLPDHVNFIRFCVAVHESVHNLVHPADS